MGMQFENMQNPDHHILNFKYYENIILYTVNPVLNINKMYIWKFSIHYIACKVVRANTH